MSGRFSFAGARITKRSYVMICILNISLPIVRYNVTGVETFAKEMGDKGLGKPKVSLHFELSSSGISRLIKAEASVEETVVVQEAVEVDEDEEDLNRNETADADSTKSGEEETMETASESVVDAANTTEATDANATEGKKGVKKKKTKLVDKVGYMNNYFLGVHTMITD